MIKSPKSMGKIVSITFFVGLLILGAFIYKDYGVSFDEPAQRLIGATNVNHIAQKFNIQSISNNEVLSQFPKSLNQITDRDYGVIFEVPAVFIEHLFNLKQEREIYFTRHFLTFLFFFLGVIAVYKMAARRFSDWRMGLLAASFLILSPRIFADAFYNSKDLVFLSVFATAMNAAIGFVIKPNWKTALICGLACAIAMDVRVMAVIIPALTIAILAIQVIKKDIRMPQAITCLIAFFASCIIFTILFWPYLWDAPLTNFVQAMLSMSKFRHNPYLIFMGESVRASSLPWFYLPVWIGITTPIIYLGLFIVGVLAIVKALLKNQFRLWSNNNELQDLIFLSLFFGPIFAVIVLHSILYNGWRHLFFVYPAFILIVTGGSFWIWNRWSNKISRSVFGLLIFCACTHTAFWMITNHPLQNLYFNKFAGDWNRKYEVDYWGVVNKQALEKILKDKPDAPLIAWPGFGYQWPGGWQLPFTHNLKIFPKDDLLRIAIPETKNESEYIITSLRGNEGFNTDYYEFNYRYKKVDQIVVDGQPVLSIFKKLDNPELPAINVGETINFSKYQMGANYLASGWQDSEDWGAWSAGSESHLRMRFSAERPKKIIFKVRALVNTTLPKQTLQIWANDKLIKTEELSQPFENKIELNVPIDSENLDLKFKLPNAARPIDLGINKDVRQIAIGLESAQFR